MPVVKIAKNLEINIKPILPQDDSVSSSLVRELCQYAELYACSKFLSRTKDNAKALREIEFRIAETEISREKNLDLYRKLEELINAWHAKESNRDKAEVNSALEYLATGIYTRNTEYQQAVDYEVLQKPTDKLVDRAPIGEFSVLPSDFELGHNGIAAKGGKYVLSLGGAYDPEVSSHRSGNYKHRLETKITNSIKRHFPDFAFYSKETRSLILGAIFDALIQAKVLVPTQQDKSRIDKKQYQVELEGKTKGHCIDQALDSLVKNNTLLHDGIREYQAVAYIFKKIVKDNKHPFPEEIFSAHGQEALEDLTLLLHAFARRHHITLNEVLVGEAYPQLSNYNIQYNVLDKIAAVISEKIGKPGKRLKLEHLKQGSGLEVLLESSFTQDKANNLKPTDDHYRAATIVMAWSLGIKEEELVLDTEEKRTTHGGWQFYLARLMFERKDQDYTALVAKLKKTDNIIDVLSELRVAPVPYVKENDGYIVPPTEDLSPVVRHEIGRVLSPLEIFMSLKGHEAKTAGKDPVEAREKAKEQFETAGLSFEEYRDVISLYFAHKEGGMKNLLDAMLMRDNPDSLLATGHLQLQQLALHKSIKELHGETNPKHFEKRVGRVVRQIVDIVNHIKIYHQIAGWSHELGANGGDFERLKAQSLTIYDLIALHRYAQYMQNPLVRPYVEKVAPEHSDVLEQIEDAIGEVLNKRFEAKKQAITEVLPRLQAVSHAAKPMPKGLERTLRKHQKAILEADSPQALDKGLGDFGNKVNVHLLLNLTSRIVALYGKIKTKGSVETRAEMIKTFCQSMFPDTAECERILPEITNFMEEKLRRTVGRDSISGEDVYTFLKANDAHADLRVPLFLGWTLKDDERLALKGDVNKAKTAVLLAAISGLGGVLKAIAQNNAMNKQQLEQAVQDIAKKFSALDVTKSNPVLQKLVGDIRAFKSGDDTRAIQEVISTLHKLYQVGEQLNSCPLTRDKADRQLAAKLKACLDVLDEDILANVRLLGDDGQERIFSFEYDRKDLRAALSSYEQVLAAHGQKLEAAAKPKDQDRRKHAEKKVVKANDAPPKRKPVSARKPTLIEVGENGSRERVYQAPHTVKKSSSDVEEAPSVKKTAKKGTEVGDKPLSRAKKASSRTEEHSVKKTVAPVATLQPPVPSDSSSEEQRVTSRKKRVGGERKRPSGVEHIGANPQGEWNGGVFEVAPQPTKVKSKPETVEPTKTTSSKAPSQPKKTVQTQTRVKFEGEDSTTTEEATTPPANTNASVTVSTDANLIPVRKKRAVTQVVFTSKEARAYSNVYMDFIDKAMKFLKTLHKEIPDAFNAKEWEKLKHDVEKGKKTLISSFSQAKAEIHEEVTNILYPVMNHIIAAEAWLPHLGFEGMLVALEAHGALFVEARAINRAYNFQYAKDDKLAPVFKSPAKGEAIEKLDKDLAKYRKAVDKLLKKQSPENKEEVLAHLDMLGAAITGYAAERNTIYAAKQAVSHYIGAVDGAFLQVEAVEDKERVKTAIQVLPEVLTSAAKQRKDQKAAIAKINLPGVSDVMQLQELAKAASDLLQEFVYAFDIHERDSSGVVKFRETVNELLEQIKPLSVAKALNGKGQTELMRLRDTVLHQIAREVTEQVNGYWKEISSAPAQQQNIRVLLGIASLFSPKAKAARVKFTEKDWDTLCVLKKKLDGLHKPAKGTEVNNAPRTRSLSVAPRPVLTTEAEETLWRTATKPSTAKLKNVEKGGETSADSMLAQPPLPSMLDINSTGIESSTSAKRNGPPRPSLAPDEKVTPKQVAEQASVAEPLSPSEGKKPRPEGKNKKHGVDANRDALRRLKEEREREERALAFDEGSSSDEEDVVLTDEALRNKVVDSFYTQGILLDKAHRGDVAKAVDVWLQTEKEILTSRDTDPATYLMILLRSCDPDVTKIIRNEVATVIFNETYARYLQKDIPDAADPLLQQLRNAIQDSMDAVCKRDRSVYASLQARDVSSITKTVLGRQNVLDVLKVIKEHIRIKNAQELAEARVHFLQAQDEEEISGEETTSVVLSETDREDNSSAQRSGEENDVVSSNDESVETSVAQPKIGKPGHTPGKAHRASRIFTSVDKLLADVINAVIEHHKVKDAGQVIALSNLVRTIIVTEKKIDAVAASTANRDDITQEVLKDRRLDAIVGVKPPVEEIEQLVSVLGGLLQAPSSDKSKRDTPPKQDDEAFRKSLKEEAKRQAKEAKAAKDEARRAKKEAAEQRKLEEKARREGEKKAEAKRQSLLEVDRAKEKARKEREKQAKDEEKARFVQHRILLELIKAIALQNGNHPRFVDDIDSGRAIHESHNLENSLDSDDLEYVVDKIVNWKKGDIPASLEALQELYHTWLAEPDISFAPEAVTQRIITLLDDNKVKIPFWATYPAGDKKPKLNISSDGWRKAKNQQFLQTSVFPALLHAVMRSSPNDQLWKDEKAINALLDVMTTGSQEVQKHPHFMAFAPVRVEYRRLCEELGKDTERPHSLPYYKFIVRQLLNLQAVQQAFANAYGIKNISAEAADSAHRAKKVSDITELLLDSLTINNEILVRNKTQEDFLRWGGGIIACSTGDLESEAYDPLKMNFLSDEYSIARAYVDEGKLYQYTVSLQIWSLLTYLTNNAQDVEYIINRRELQALHSQYQLSSGPEKVQQEGHLRERLKLKPEDDLEEGFKEQTSLEKPIYKKIDHLFIQLTPKLGRDITEYVAEIKSTLSEERRTFLHFIAGVQVEAGAALLGHYSKDVQQRAHLLNMQADTGFARVVTLSQQYDKDIAEQINKIPENAFITALSREQVREYLLPLVEAFYNQKRIDRDGGYTIGEYAYLFVHACNALREQFPIIFGYDIAILTGLIQVKADIQPYSRVFPGAERFIQSMYSQLNFKELLQDTLRHYYSVPPDVFKTVYENKGVEAEYISALSKNNDKIYDAVYTLLQSKDFQEELIKLSPGAKQFIKTGVKAFAKSNEVHLSAPEGERGKKNETKAKATSSVSPSPSSPKLPVVPSTASNAFISTATATLSDASPSQSPLVAGRRHNKGPVIKVSGGSDALQAKLLPVYGALKDFLLSNLSGMEEEGLRKHFKSKESVLLPLVKGVNNMQDAEAVLACVEFQIGLIEHCTVEKFFKTAVDAFKALRASPVVQDHRDASESDEEEIPSGSMVIIDAPGRGQTLLRNLQIIRTVKTLSPDAQARLKAFEEKFAAMGERIEDAQMSLLENEFDRIENGEGPVHTPERPSILKPSRNGHEKSITQFFEPPSVSSGSTVPQEQDSVMRQVSSPPPNKPLPALPVEENGVPTVVLPGLGDSGQIIGTYVQSFAELGGTPKKQSDVTVGEYVSVLPPSPHANGNGALLRQESDVTVGLHSPTLAPQPSNANGGLGDQAEVSIAPSVAKKPVWLVKELEKGPNSSPTARPLPTPPDSGTPNGNANGHVNGTPPSTPPSWQKTVGGAKKSASPSYMKGQSPSFAKLIADAKGINLDEVNQRLSASDFNSNSSTDAPKPPPFWFA